MNRLPYWCFSSTFATALYTLLFGCFRSPLGAPCTSDQQCLPYICDDVCKPSFIPEPALTDAPLTTSGGGPPTGVVSESTAGVSSTGVSSGTGAVTLWPTSEADSTTTGQTATTAQDTGGDVSTSGGTRSSTTCGDNNLQATEDCDVVTSQVVDHSDTDNPYLIYCEQCTCVGQGGTSGGDYNQQKCLAFPGRCVNLKSDPQACGSCSYKCPEETPQCINGLCE